uniref:Uncharacterized protein n=1 Tax=Arundo donax TaxID=35708 RepID=A0A0A9BEH0_ARUDO
MRHLHDWYMKESNDDGKCAFIVGFKDDDFFDGNGSFICEFKDLYDLYHADALPCP